MIKVKCGHSSFVVRGHDARRAIENIGVRGPSSSFIPRLFFAFVGVASLPGTSRAIEFDNAPLVLAPRHSSSGRLGTFSRAKQLSNHRKRLPHYRTIVIGTTNTIIVNTTINTNAIDE